MRPRPVHLLRVVLLTVAAAAAAQTVPPPADTTATTPPPTQAVAPDGKAHSFRAEGGQFLLDGKPFQVISGEMHYPRIPREYWRARLKMAKAMGLNAITTYVFWNVHEPKPGAYDFTGQNDVAEFLREAQQEGLWVVLRPGPYVCAEWEFGGYPSWLLKDPRTVVRSQDPKYMDPATRWIKRLGQELAPLQVDRGGPILLVQVENEYGSFGHDHVYMDLNRKALLDAGFTGAQMYTADGPGDIANGSLPDLPVGINFDGNKPGQAAKAFATLKAKRPDSPPFNSEFWAGWFDHWGSAHAHTDAKVQADNLAWELNHGYSVSIYMFHGGTDFGWMNGANSSDAKQDYQPDVTSYDYDAALDESGRPTPKYFAFRDVIAKATGIAPPPAPQVAAPLVIPPIQFKETAGLFAKLPRPIQSDRPLTMEEIGQSYGYILYITQVRLDTGDLTIHDYARGFLDGEPAANAPFDRRLDMLHLRNDLSKLSGAAGAKEHTLGILVENSGRINYSHQMLTDRKGIVSYVPAEHEPAAKWYMYPFPMTNPSALHFRKRTCKGPCFYRARFDLPAGTQPADTFLDTSTLSKGQIWVNGHALGRFWNIGPQNTLYLPGPWLKEKKNEIVVFDLDGKRSITVQGLAKPELGQTASATPTGNP